MRFFFILVIGVISGFLASNIASDKAHDGFSWFFAGLFFGPLGLIAAAGLSDKRIRRILNNDRKIRLKQDAMVTAMLSEKSSVVPDQPEGEK